MRQLIHNAAPVRGERPWTQRLIQSNAFAWALSLGLHGLLFGGFYAAVLREESAVRRIIIPEARLTSAAGPSVDSPPIEQEPLQLDPAADQPSLAPEMSVSDEQIVAAVAGDDLPSLVVPVDQPVASESLLTAQAAGGAAPDAPLSNFFGQAGNAYKVVYVVDVSASLMIYIDDILREMRDSIHGLVPTQRFHIVLARPRKVEELASRRLVPAIARYKKEADDFLATVDRIPKPGKADPIEAMRRAFAVGPELIYFLSDGDYIDIETELERELQRLNPRREVCITTIGFHPPRPESDRPELLQRIAEWHNGHFRLVEIK